MKALKTCLIGALTLAIAVDIAEASCYQYGHACFGGHGKRSKVDSVPQQLNNAPVYQPSQAIRYPSVEEYEEQVPLSSTPVRDEANEDTRAYAPTKDDDSFDYQMGMIPRMKQHNYFRDVPRQMVNDFGRKLSNSMPEYQRNSQVMNDFLYVPGRLDTLLEKIYESRAERNHNMQDYDIIPSKKEKQSPFYYKRLMNNFDRNLPTKFLKARNENQEEDHQEQDIIKK